MAMFEWTLCICTTIGCTVPVMASGGDSLGLAVSPCSDSVYADWVISQAAGSAQSMIAIRVKVVDTVYVVSGRIDDIYLHLSRSNGISLKRGGEAIRKAIIDREPYVVAMIPKGPWFTVLYLRDVERLVTQSHVRDLVGEHFDQHGNLHSGVSDEHKAQIMFVLTEFRVPLQAGGYDGRIGLRGVCGMTR